MHVYLSPHLDDICFSLAHLAGRYHGELVNLYTRCRYVAASIGLPADEAARVEAVSRLRRAEDIRFAEATQLTRQDLELKEPALMGRHWRDLSDLEGEVAALSACLMPVLSELLPDRKSTRLNSSHVD